MPEGIAAEIAVNGVEVTHASPCDRGGLTAAVLTSFITTCKRLNIDPFAYLRDVFDRISAHPMNRLAELLPDRWKAARAADTS